MVTLFSLFFISEPSFAQSYNWQDEKGTINVSNDPGAIEFSIELETPASKKADKSERDKTLRDRLSRGNSAIVLAQRQFLIIDGKKYELSPGPRYYDAHPEEKVMDDTIQANKPIVDMQKQLIEDMRMMQQGYGTGSYGGHPSRSAPPPTNPGAIDVRTGQFYPGVAGGIINPNTGQFMPDVGGGYIDPSTGTFMPKQ
jgi:hypothetical protein